MEKVTSTVTKSKIEGHIYFLSDDLLKGRETGTPEIDIAASYLANTLRSYGVRPNPMNNTYYQDVPLEKIKPSDDFLLIIDGQEHKYKVAIKNARVKYEGLAEYVAVENQIAVGRDGAARGKLPLRRVGPAVGQVKTTEGQRVPEQISQFDPVVSLGLAAEPLADVRANSSGDG